LFEKNDDSILEIRVPSKGLIPMAAGIAFATVLTLILVPILMTLLRACLKIAQFVRVQA
jgi:hypothetical protein